MRLDFIKDFKIITLSELLILFNNGKESHL